MTQSSLAEPALQPRTSPLGVLDLMLMIAGVGLALPLSSATVWPLVMRAMSSAGRLSQADRMHFLLDCALSMIQGLAFGVLLCLGRRRFWGNLTVTDQPGHWLLLLPIPYYLLTGPIRHLWWFSQQNSVDIIKLGIEDWIHTAVEFLAVVSMGLVVIWLGRNPGSFGYRVIVAFHALLRLQGLLESIPVIRTVWLRVSLSRPWFIGVWLWCASELLQLLTTLIVMGMELRRGTQRDWLHYAGGTLWSIHCALNLGQAATSLISLYWR